MKIAIVNKETLQIASWYDADALNQGSYGGEWGSPDLFEHVGMEGSDTVGASAVLVPAVEEDLEADPPVEAVPAHIVIEIDEAAQNAAAMDKLRALRDQKLKESDWTQMPDSPLIAEDKDAWADYRAELRDLPANTIDPKAPVWPTEPA